MSLLQGYPYEIVKQFYDISDEMRVLKNWIIYDVDDTPDYLYFVKEGEFSIYTEKTFTNKFKEITSSHSQSYSLNLIEPKEKTQRQKKIFCNTERGRFVQLKILGQGECFGEEELVRKKGVEYSRVYRVVCNSEHGTLYAIPKKLLFKLLPQHPSVVKVMQIQIKNKDMARSIRLQQLRGATFQNEEIRIDGTVKRTNDIPVKDTFIQKPHLLKNSNKKLITEDNLIKTVKVAQNCEMAEDLFKQDDHNYLIYSARIATNQYLHKNPKIRKDDATDEQAEENKKKLVLKEIDKTRYLKMMEILNQDSTEHESRSTLLYEENLKKKKIVNQSSKAVSVFEDEYIKDFSQRFNIPASELNSSKRRIQRQGSNLSENLADTPTLRRTASEFLQKANLQKNLILEHSKSKFCENIPKHDQITHTRTISLTSRDTPRNNNVNQSTAQHQKSQSSFCISQPNSPLLNTDLSQFRIVDINLDEIKDSSIERGGLEYNKISGFKEGQSALSHNNSGYGSPSNKSFINNTPKHSRSKTEVFKFLKPEYNNSPTIKKQQTLLTELKSLPPLPLFAKNQSYYQTYSQLNHANSTIAQSINFDLKRQPSISNRDSECEMIPKQEKNKSSRLIGSQNESIFGQTSHPYFTERQDLSKRTSPTISVTKLIQPSIINNKIPAKDLSSLQVNLNTIHTKKIFSQDMDYSKFLLKDAAEDIFKSKLPTTVRIKRFQLSQTFKSIDKGNNLIQQVNGDGIYTPQPKQLFSNQKQQFLSRQPSPLK